MLESSCNLFQDKVPLASSFYTYEYIGNKIFNRLLLIRFRFLYLAAFYFSSLLTWLLFFSELLTRPLLITTAFRFGRLLFCFMFDLAASKSGCLRAVPDTALTKDSIVKSKLRVKPQKTEKNEN